MPAVEHARFYFAILVLFSHTAWASDLQNVDLAVRLAYTASRAEQMAFAVGENSGMVSEFHGTIRHGDTDSSVTFRMTWFSQATFMYSQAYHSASSCLTNSQPLGDLDRIKLAAVLSRVGWWFYWEFERHQKDHGILGSGTSPLSILEQAHRLSPSSPILMIKLAEVKKHRAKSKTKEVMELLQSAEKTLPKSPDVYRALYKGTPHFDAAKLESIAENFSPELSNFSRSYPAANRNYIIRPDGTSLLRKKYVLDHVDVCEFRFSPGKF
jgi:hypothetical protein